MLKIKILSPCYPAKENDAGQFWALAMCRGFLRSNYLKVMSNHTAVDDGCTADAFDSKMGSTVTVWSGRTLSRDPSG
jgi:hypothetical protein